MPDAGSSPVLKKEHSREQSLDSVGSSADAGAGAGAGAGASTAAGEQDAPPGKATTPPLAEAPAPKRKGGRKPIYATSEERKQRNRQAQAAFRERRTEYIKQLETTIKHHEENLQTLQQSHRSAADECLMLRYKNSLLERILLEKGIDVQGELKKKEISIPTKVPPSLPQPSAIQRAAMNRRHQYSRSASSSISLIPPATAGTVFSHTPSVQSSGAHPTSPSNLRSPLYANSMRAPSGDFKTPPAPLRVNPGAQLSSPTTVTPLQAIAPSPLSQPSSAGIATSTTWPSPFETHMQQLEQEYDAHADMIDEQDPEDSVTGPGPYPQDFSAQFPDHTMPPVSDASGTPTQLSPINDLNGSLQALAGFDNFDPMLDTDPFGLTASMQFPTQFSFQESSMRK